MSYASVGFGTEPPPCPQNQIWDPDLSTCLDLICPQGQKPYFGKCIPATSGGGGAPPTTTTTVAKSEPSLGPLGTVAVIGAVGGLLYLWWRA